ncbi:helix-turn-helix domain-containing protein [Ruania zhangjianzhongii]|uniref:helix-turn-helix domain-containing protein n=1 Tax=Ruania zhangjianzhongii TaxID=2603206 RepID=UPI0039A0D0A1
MAENREAGVTIEQIAADFGVHPMTLHKWLQRARSVSGEVGSSQGGFVLGSSGGVARTAQP